MLYKPDWQESKQRYLQWWAGEDFGRCGLSVRAPRKTASINPPQLPENVDDRWLDKNYLCEINNYRMSQTFYGGEAIPVWNAGYPGWDFIPAYLGCNVTLKEETGWVEPIINTECLEDFDFRSLQIKPDNKWWQFAQMIHKLAVGEAYGKAIPGIQAIGGVGDVLAGLRGSDRLLLDLMDCPDAVRDCELYLMKIWIDVYNQFYQITHSSTEGSTNFFHMWAPGRFYIVSNDFSYMISTQMYTDIFLPALELQMKNLDHMIYHVDGVDAFRHVDLLCDLSRLDGLQILPGDGKPSPLHYMDVLKKVQAAGKKLYITIPAEEVEAALANLSSRGLFIETKCSSEDEAKDLLKLAEKWSRYI